MPRTEIGWPPTHDMSPTNEPTTNHGCTADTTRIMLAGTTHRRAVRQHGHAQPVTRLSPRYPPRDCFLSRPGNRDETVSTTANRAVPVQHKELAETARNRPTNTRPTATPGNFAGTNRYHPSVIPRFRRIHCPNRLRVALAHADDAPSPTRYTHMQRGTRLVTATRRPPAVPQSLVGRAGGGHHPHADSRHS